MIIKIPEIKNVATNIILDEYFTFSSSRWSITHPKIRLRILKTHPKFKIIEHIFRNAIYSKFDIEIYGNDELIKMHIMHGGWIHQWDNAGYLWLSLNILGDYLEDVPYNIDEIFQMHDNKMKEILAR
jgi:hypothetical protein